MSSGQLASQFLEAIFPAGCQDEVCCARCQFFSEATPIPALAPVMSAHFPDQFAAARDLAFCKAPSTKHAFCYFPGRG